LHGPMVAILFAKRTQGRVDSSRSLNQEAQEIIEDLGPKMVSSQQLGTLRAPSVKRWGVEAATVAVRSPSRQRVTFRSVVGDVDLGSSTLALVPKRAQPTTRSLAPGR
jgi:hypothetical protein